MSKLIFSKSASLTLGLELELQLINPESKRLIAGAKDLIRTIRNSKYKDQIKPEVTQGMIELNSLVHKTPQTLHEELLTLSSFLEKQGKLLDIKICGGGSHPFQNWNENKIFPIARFKNLSWQYRYLSKCFTVFALHVHVGCKNSDNALYLTHLFSRYIPQFIALSASSPFYEGADTGFNSSRLNTMGSFPTSGHAPPKTTWKDFSAYYFQLRKLKIIHSMKDIYWDIRPKPAFGTVEIRIFDTPLTLHHATTIAAYVQMLAQFLLENRATITEDIYLPYSYNRFQACRFGFDGRFINPFTKKSCTIQEDILATVALLKPHAYALNTTRYLKKIHTWAKKKHNDTVWIKKTFAKSNSLEKLVQRQCELWFEQF